MAVKYRENLSISQAVQGRRQLPSRLRICEKRGSEGFGGDQLGKAVILVDKFLVDWALPIALGR
jgi:hypothetical protein